MADTNRTTRLVIAYTLLVLGLHRFYLGRPITGLIQVTAGFAPMVFIGIGNGSMAEGLSVIAMLAVAVWCLIDALFIPRWVSKP